MIGGSAALNVFIGMARAKAGAVFLGPEGVGLVGLYYHLIALLRTVSGLGIDGSGVRQVASAAGSGDAEKIGRTVQTLRKVCWLTGIGGWLMAAVFAWPLSQWIFGNHDHVGAIVLIGAVLLFSAISGGQMAVVQGMRRISELATFNVVSSVLASGVAVLSYWLLGWDGIVPSIVAGGALTLVTSWWFARRIDVPDSAEVRWVEALRESKGLLGLGLAFMWSGLLQTSGMLIRSGAVVKVLGLQANGLYSAAWSISGMFSNMILGAMGTDFYPRLTSVSGDHNAMRRLVNEQTEVGILLALPVLLATLVFAPLAIAVLYSGEFLEAADLLQWFAVGMFLRVTSWPLAYIMLAKSEAKLFALTETLSNGVHVILAISFLTIFGLVGIPIAFLVLYTLYNGFMLIVSRRLIGFLWSNAVLKLVAVSGALVAACFGIRQGMQGTAALLLGGGLVLFSGVFCMRGLALRIGTHHRLIRWALRVPGLRGILETKATSENQSRGRR